MTNRSPTKAEEIAALRALGDSLGPCSYLGPWIKEVLPGVETDIRNDIGVSAPMPGAARLEAARILEDAKSEAKRLIDEAQATCKRARSDCEARLRESMAAAARSLDDRARELRRLAA